MFMRLLYAIRHLLKILSTIGTGKKECFCIAYNDARCSARISDRWSENKIAYSILLIYRQNSFKSYRSQVYCPF